ncbi:MAG: FAD:protein FMN transferase [Mariprofundales bacterium]
MLRLLLALCLLIAGCSNPDPLTHQTRYMMGTLVEFSLYGAKRSTAESAINAAAEEMTRVEKLFTTHHASPVAQFNRGKGALPDEVAQLLVISEQIRQQSGGAFHIGLGALNRVWGFSDDQATNRTLPTLKQVAALLPPAQCVVKKDGEWQLVDRRCQLDFGGIAKGYAIDRGIAVLQAHHIRNAIINAGGDMRIIGQRGDKKWRIGIRHPRQADQVVATLELAGDISVVTSGDYERFVIRDGRRYHHILDPSTGEPAMRAMSATVISPHSATLADGWSTALFVRGRAGLNPLQQAGMIGLVVDRYGKIDSSPAMRQWMVPHGKR